MKMLQLNDKTEWDKLDSPFRNSAEIPKLIEKLAKTFDHDLLVEITTEYISHQMSLYEITFATFPHLIAICENTDDPTFRLQTLLDVSVVFSDYGGDEEMDAIFANSKCEASTISEIKKAFKEAFKKLNSIANSLTHYILRQDDSEKKYFLLALAVANEIHPVSDILWRYHENEEYECCCPKCDELFVLWNEDDRLVIYKEDPVSEKAQEKFPVQPSSLSPANFSETISANKNYEWLSYYIHSLNIESLKTTVNYLFGKSNCPYCKAEFNVFENIQ